MAETATPGDLRARVEELEARVREMEQREQRTGAVRSLLRELLPPEVREHLRSARREQLLAFRSFIDHWIERAERDEASAKRETIAVD
jgi:hypothetical protein